jgi:hypothetical protein
LRRAKTRRGLPPAVSSAGTVFERRQVRTAETESRSEAEEQRAKYAESHCPPGELESRDLPSKRGRAAPAGTWIAQRGGAPKGDGQAGRAAEQRQQQASVNNWRKMSPRCRRSPARWRFPCAGAPRASIMLATLRDAISNTTAAIEAAAPTEPGVRPPPVGWC